MSKHLQKEIPSNSPLNSLEPQEQSGYEWDCSAIKDATSGSGLCKGRTISFPLSQRGIEGDFSHTGRNQVLRGGKFGMTHAYYRKSGHG